MSHTSSKRPGEPDIPAYCFVPGTPDPVYHSTNGCTGCAFRSYTETKIRCSRIPCQLYPGQVAKLIQHATL